MAGSGERQELRLSGSDCVDQKGGGGAGRGEESRCSLAPTLLTASVTGPLSYYDQPVFGVCVCGEE